jgi:hypothetical protein
MNVHRRYFTEITWVFLAMTMRAVGLANNTLHDHRAYSDTGAWLALVLVGAMVLLPLAGFLVPRPSGYSPVVRRALAAIWGPPLVVFLGVPLAFGFKLTALYVLTAGPAAVVLLCAFVLWATEGKVWEEEL